jgi:hypothetical protein
MDIISIFKIVFGVVSTISISGVVVWFFVKLSANTLADNYKKKIEHNFEKKIESYKTQLEILKTTTLKYNDKQFELYLDLWKNLQELKFACIDLWNMANNSNLNKFAISLKKTYRQLETTSILIEDKHYVEISEIIRKFQEFDTGKVKLIKARNNNANDRNDNFDNNQIEQMIEYNRERKDRCLEIIEEMKTSIKDLIKGKNKF